MRKFIIALCIALPTFFAIGIARDRCPRYKHVPVRYRIHDDVGILENADGSCIYYKRGIFVVLKPTLDYTVAQVGSYMTLEYVGQTSAVFKQKSSITLGE